MRVLKIIHTMGHGGAENIYRWLAWGLMQNGIDVVAGIPLNNDPRTTENWITPALEELGLSYETFDKTGNAFALVRNMKALIKRVRPDIVHSHLLDSNFYSSLTCKLLSVPHVCTEHGDISMNESISGKMKFILLSCFTNNIVCVSEAVRQNATPVALFPNKLTLIHNGIMVRDVKESTFRREVGIPDIALVIGNVGNLYPVKGQKYLIRAFSELIKCYPDSYLVLVGRGNERRDLEILREELHVPEKKVLFTGFRNDIANIIRSFDIYVQPSLSEGLPVSLLEAMSLGIPVIATDVGGAAEIIRNDEYGMLVARCSSKELYTGLKKVIENREASIMKALRAKEMVNRQFSLNAMTTQYINLYEKLLQRNRDRYFTN
jgi:glycosyltransferase involved in cell wall biosynthesis